MPALVASVSTKPNARKPSVVRDGASPPGGLNSRNPAYPSITGNRNEGPPNSSRNTSASQAPAGPIQFATSPGSPVYEKPGSDGS